MSTKITVASSALAAATSYLQPFSSRSRHEDTVVLTVEGERLTVGVDDGAFAGRYNLVIDDNAPSIRTALSLRLLHDVARLSPDGTMVGLELHPQEPCVVTAGPSRYRFPTKDAPRENPAHEEALSVVEVDGPLFARSCRLAAHAVAKTDGRTIALRGMLIDISVERFSIVATDGYRIAVAEKRRIAPQDGESLATGKAIVHRDYLQSLLAVVESEQPVTLIFRSRSLQVISGRRWASLPVMDGKYPPWRKMVVEEIRKEAPQILRTSAGSFLAAVRQVGTMTTDETRAVSVSSEEGRAYLSLAGQDGVARVEVAAMEVGNFEPVLLNADYLKDSVQGLKLEDEIVWQFRPKRIPAVMSADRYKEIVMPMDADGVQDAGS